MKCSASAVAAVLAALCASASAQVVGDGPVPAMTSPPTTIYSSSPPSAAVRPMSPALPKVTPSSIAPPPRATGFAAGSVPTAVPLSADSRGERRFLRDAAAQSRFELDASKLAFAKSGNTGVRALAASLINHHNVVGLELTHLLNARGMAMPMLSNEQRKTLNLLAKANGGKFDAIYMQQVGMAQAAVAREYEKASAAIHEPQINGWIVKTLATTRYHQNMAERSVQAGSSARLARAAVRPTTAAPAGTAGIQSVSARVDGRVSESNSR